MRHIVCTIVLLVSSYNVGMRIFGQMNSHLVKIVAVQMKIEMKKTQINSMDVLVIERTIDAMDQYPQKNMIAEVAILMRIGRMKKKHIIGKGYVLD